MEPFIIISIAATFIYCGLGLGVLKLGHKTTEIYPALFLLVAWPILLLMFAAGALKPDNG